MPKRLIITLVCFHISAAASLLIGLGLIILGLFVSDQITGIPIPGNQPEMGSMMSALRMMWPLVGVSVIFSGGVLEVVAWGLKQLKYWAWIAGIVVSGLMIISGLHTALVSLIVGGLSLWGLVDPESVAAFKPKNEGGESSI